MPDKIFKKVIYIIGILGLMLVCLEFVLRALGYPDSTVHIIFDKHCYWRMAPNQKIRFKDTYGQNAAVTINSLGARGKEFPSNKPPGEQRILCLGDSFTYGHGVGDEQTYPFHLQNLMDNDPLNIKVINFGCNGHTILQEVDFLRNYGLGLEPDYVILETSLFTDFCDIDELEYNIGYMPAPGYNFIKYWVRKTSIGNILLKFWNSRKVKDIIIHRRQSQRADREDSRKKNSFEIYTDKLDELVKLGKEKNFKIIYLIMPIYKNTLAQYTIDCASYDGKNITARGFCEFLRNKYNDEITVVELSLGFEGQDLFLPDTHLNDKGNRLAAERIYGVLKAFADKVPKEAGLDK